MMTLNFTCTFKSDIVLHASSNTEGKIERLDYIPGSNFLGMVAKYYKDFGTDAFKVFHSGTVRFGDGHIVIDEKPTYHVPFSWFVPKGVSLDDAINDHDLYNEHFISSDEYDAFIAKGQQLKQQRNGFVSIEGIVKNSEHFYTQKSAYDSKKRRSKDKQMFGYYALSKGSKWHFTVEIDDDAAIHEEQIKTAILGSKRLGKSRSAEYGNIEIVETEIESNIDKTNSVVSIDGDSYIFLYAKSRLALTNKFGINCYKFDKTSLNIDQPDVQIDWEKSQIRISRYTPYVGSRANFDPERLIIDKGSVIALKVPVDFDLHAYAERIQKGIGLYLSEGHGKIVLNPVFLTTTVPQFANRSQKNIIPIPTYTSRLNTWLEAEKKMEKEKYDFLLDVKSFIADNISQVKNKKSQWGQIRSLCTAANTNEEIYEALFSRESENNHEKGFLRHGRALKKWDSVFIESLASRYDENREEKRDYLDFLKLLSIYAPKKDNKEKNEKNEKGAADE